jgi:hypothetical protein
VSVVALPAASNVLIERNIPPPSDLSAENEIIRSAINRGHQEEILSRVEKDLGSLLPIKGGESTETATLLDTIGVYFVSVGNTNSGIGALEAALRLRQEQY